MEKGVMCIIPIAKGSEMMGYYDVPPGNANRELGRKIYLKALSDRRGFRDDQLGIDDPDIWAEIFENIGKIARRAIRP